MQSLFIKILLRFHILTIIKRALEQENDKQIKAISIISPAEEIAKTWENDMLLIKCLMLIIKQMKGVIFLTSNKFTA